MATVTAQIQVRRDSAADWTSNDPTLAQGEIGYETDTGKFKFGDGTNPWSSLAYANPDESILANSTGYTVTDNDGYSYIMVSSSCSAKTITLPTAADNSNREVTIKKVDSNSGYVTIDGEGAETIDGSTTKRLATQYSFMQLISDGTEWHVANFYHAPYLTTWTGSTDWTNAEYTMTHNFGANLSDLSVSVYLSSDGTEGNAFEIGYITSGSAGPYGITFFQSSTDAIKMQTGTDGILYVSDSGAQFVLDTEGYSYKAVINKRSP